MHWEMRNIHKILAGNSHEERNLGRMRMRGCGLDYLPRDAVQCLVILKTVIIFGFSKRREIS
jgi:hypothetical protein